MYQTVREGFTRVSTNLAENITGMRVVTAFNRQDPNLRVFNRLQDTNTTNNVAVARINGVSRSSRPRSGRRPPRARRLCYIDAGWPLDVPGAARPSGPYAG